jgi:hypothetical protein
MGKCNENSGPAKRRAPVQINPRSRMIALDDFFMLIRDSSIPMPHKVEYFGP